MRPDIREGFLKRRVELVAWLEANEARVGEGELRTVRDAVNNIDEILNGKFDLSRQAAKLRRHRLHR